jgi:hypothetical protein
LLGSEVTMTDDIVDHVGDWPRVSGLPCGVERRLAKLLAEGIEAVSDGRG